MKSKAYIVEYLQDEKWLPLDVMSVNTLRWNEWKREPGVGAFAHMRTEKENLRLRITKRGVREWNVVPFDLVKNMDERIGVIEFTMKNGSSVSVEPSGDKSENLMIRLSRPVDIEATGSVACTQIYRLSAGIHTLENCDRISLYEGIPTLLLRDGDHIILEEGAVLRSRILGEGVSNVAVTGTGILDMTEWNGSPENSDTRRDAIFLDKFCKNVYIADITIRNSAFFCIRTHAVTNLEVKGISAFTGVFEGDGIDLHGAIDVKISDCLLRNSDDCIALYPSRSDMRNVEVTNCVLWSDLAHAINIGVHGSGRANDRHYAENIVFKDMRILEVRCPSVDYQGAIAISLGDESICRHVAFEDFIVEDFSDSQLFVFKVMQLRPWNATPGYRIEHVLLKNIFYRGQNKNGSALLGYDAERIVDDVAIENLKINGEQMTSLDMAGIQINDFVKHITIK